MPIGTMAAMLDALTAGAVASADEASAEAMVLASQMVINAMGAIQAQSIASLAAREREQAASVAGTPPEGLARDAGAPVDEWEFLGDRIAPLLAMTGRGAQSRVDLACELTRRLPRTLAAMRAGGLDTYRAGIIATQASLVRPHLVPTLEEHLFPDAAVDTPGPQVPDARDLHSTRLKARLRRLTARIDPQSIDRRCEQARRDRFVAIGPGVTPGITHWSADLPVEDSMKAWAAIDALAHDYVHQTPRSDGRRRTLTQARADAMVDLLMGAATVSTTLQVTVPLEVVEGGEAEEVANTAVAAADPAVTRRRRGPDLTQLRELAIPAATGVAGAVPLGVEVPRHGLLPLVQAQSLAREPGTTLTALFTDSRTGRRLPGQDPGGDSPGAVPAGSAMSGMPADPAASGKPSSWSCRARHLPRSRRARHLPRSRRARRLPRLCRARQPNPPHSAIARRPRRTARCAPGTAPAGSRGVRWPVSAATSTT